MSDARSEGRSLSHPEGEDPHAWLRQMGARAHQLRAATRAADHYVSTDTADDRNTASWLMSSAVGLAQDLADDIDGLARALKERPSDSALQQRVAALRVRTHQLHAATRAADHFLEQDTLDGRETGGWLIATALGLAQKLASEIDDGAAPLRRAVIDKSQIEPHDAALSRRMATATTPLRGAA